MHRFSLFHFRLQGQHLSICPATQDAVFPWLPAKSGGGPSTWWCVEETSRTRGHGFSGNISSQSQRSDLNDPIMKTHYSGTLMKQLCSSLLFPASFTLPEQGQHLDQVMFVELSSDEALKLLMHYKEEARRLLPTPPKRKKHRQGSQNRPVHHCGKKRFHFCCCIVQILILEHDITWTCLFIFQGWRGGPVGSHYTSLKAQVRLLMWCYTIRYL